MTSNSQSVLSAKSISKKYCRDLKRSFIYGAFDIGNEILGRASTERREGEFWALRDVSFELRRGESLGLIGSNGSGKTTLLKTLCGIVKPNTGSVRIQGRVAPLIALGAGFNPVLSGRENIFINLAILGIPHDQIVEKVDSIIDFAEIREAIDAPVRTYSSGMAARLGFACAIHTDPQVLFVDEVLAVGDARFRAKCYRKLAELRENGTAFILVSHAANAILNSCQSVLYLNKGQMLYHGPAAEGVQLYQADLAAGSENSIQNSDLAVAASAGASAKILAVAVADARGIDGTLKSGETSTIKISFETSQPKADLSVYALIKRQGVSQQDVLSLDSRRDGEVFKHPGGTGSIDLKLERCGLTAGRYSIKVALCEGSNLNVLDLSDQNLFDVEADLLSGPSAFNQPRSWMYNRA